jgi:predicted MFS family arabinose efflux permease
MQLQLGIVRQRGFDRQFGRNRVANHAGNVVGAALSGWLGWRFGFGAIFALGAALRVLSVTAALLVPVGAIDHDHARGLERAGSSEPQSGLRILLGCRPLLLPALALCNHNLDCPTPAFKQTYICWFRAHT